MISAFDDHPEETFTAGQSFRDCASSHRISLNGGCPRPETRVAHLRAVSSR